MAAPASFIADFTAEVVQLAQKVCSVTLNSLQSDDLCELCFHLPARESVERWTFRGCADSRMKTRTRSTALADGG